ncbi:helix-turn-helix domain-containing protein [Pseudonocardia acaciae]|uniref:helix-turn-helix domain-containing protein n=1 Tax=Pseudonocardia acaciae TaxID=551276 RepID=UPI0014705CD8|nr:helix-turn-helix transcriptional regulator [Pseudonocardia acaciae]
MTSIGETISQARQALGWSQARLARVLNQTADHDSLTRAYVSRWERGVRKPGYFWLPHIAQVLGLDPAQTDLTTVDDVDVAHRGESDHIADVVGDPSGSWEVSPVPTRRQVVGYLGAGFTALGLERTAGRGALPRVVAALETTCAVGPSDPGRNDLENLDELVAHYRRTFRHTLPEELYEEVLGVREYVGSLLEATPASRSRDVAVIAGWLSNLLALLTHDLADRGASLVWCTDADRCGRRAEHPELSGWAAQTRVLMSFYDGHARQAVAHAQRGQSCAPLGTVAHAKLVAQEMRAWALLRDSRMVAQTRRSAEKAISKLPSDLPARGAFSINLADDPPYTATSLLLLGQYREAAAATKRVMKTYYRTGDGVHQNPSGFARTQLILGLALAGLGELGEAYAVASAALNTPRIVQPVAVLAKKIDHQLTHDFPGTTEAREYHDLYLTVMQDAHSGS